jgi:hypothetical protein
VTWELDGGTQIGYHITWELNGGSIIGYYNFGAIDPMADSAVELSKLAPGSQGSAVRAWKRIRPASRQRG